jgi:hypothetical protein
VFAVCSFSDDGSQFGLCSKRPRPFRTVEGSGSIPRNAGRSGLAEPYPGCGSLAVRGGECCEVIERFGEGLATPDHIDDDQHIRRVFRAKKLRIQFPWSGPEDVVGIRGGPRRYLLAQESSAIVDENSYSDDEADGQEDADGQSQVVIATAAAPAQAMAGEQSPGRAWVSA